MQVRGRAQKGVSHSDFEDAELRGALQVHRFPPPMRVGASHAQATQIEVISLSFLCANSFSRGRGRSSS